MNKKNTNEVFGYINEISTEYAHTIICGDFNANSFDDKKYSKINAITSNFIKCNDECPTYIAGKFKPSQIDFIFAKQPKKVLHYGHFPALGISNHQVLYIIYNILPNRKKMKYINCDHTKMREATFFVIT